MMEATTSSEDSGAEKQQYTMTEFTEYMSSDLSNEPSDPPNYHVFWSLPQANPSSSTSGPAARVKQWLHSLTWVMWDSLLIQFWEPETIKGRRFLTTAQQPFALKMLYKGLSWYRKHCSNQNILVEGDEEGLGPLGRAFLSGQPESSPDLRCYSIKEYPLRDQALRCGLRMYMALPVFELQSNICIGVLELVSFNSGVPLVYFELTHDAFKRCDLRLPHMDGQSASTQTEGWKLALCEIKQMLRVVDETPNIPLALAWIPCQGCSGNCKCMQPAHYAFDPEWIKQYDFINNDFVQACLFHRLQPGQGVAGRALSSPHKLCFSRSIYCFNITEYPLAHYAHKTMLSTSFAICLQSAHTGSDLYVVEFFLLPGGRDGGDPRSLIHLLLGRMMRQLLSFKVASGRKWGEELLLQILRFPMDDEPIYFLKSPSDGYPLAVNFSAPESPEAEKTSPILPMAVDLAAAGDNYVGSTTQAGNTSSLPGGAEGTTAATATATASSERERKVSSFQISYQDIKRHFGMPQKEAAELLGVSLSKFKRDCKTYNIKRWPSHIRNKANNSLFEVKLPEQDAGPSQTSCSITVQETKLVTVKAQYQSKTVKFKVGTLSGIAELEEQVAKRLKLQIGSFEMRYDDEDGSPILLACDEDFCDLCANSDAILLSVAPS